MRLALLLILLFTGILSDRVVIADSDGDAKKPDVELAPSEANYKLVPGDALDISIWQEDLEEQVVVAPDGVISFPLVGSFKAEGKTIDEIKKTLEKRLGKIILDPVVTVLLQRYTAATIYVIGKVNGPGEYAINQPIDVMQALAKAGGMARFANKDDIKILRRIDGNLSTLSFDYSDVASGENLDQNIFLQDGDVIVVR